MSKKQQRHHRDDVVGESQLHIVGCCDVVKMTSAKNYSACAQRTKCPIDVEDLADFCTFLDESQAESNCCQMEIDQSNYFDIQKLDNLSVSSNQVVCNQIQPSYCSGQPPPSQQQTSQQFQKNHFVDVEDLANVFNASNQFTTCSSQSNRCSYVPQQVSSCDSINVENTSSSCSYANSLQPSFCNIPQPLARTRPVTCDKGAFEPMNLEQAAFAYCTDDRWMACPATNYCPLYDPSQRPLTSWQALPCAQNFYSYYTEDEDALEEYLYVFKI